MKILIALDFGECSKTIVKFLSAGEFPSSSNILCVHVIEPSSWQSPGFYPVIASYSESVLENHREAAKDLLLNMHSILKANYFNDVSFRLLEGEISDRISDAATEFEADIIIMAKNNKSFIEKLLLGSVSQSIIRKSTCSIAIAREEADSLAPDSACCTG